LLGNWRHRLASIPFWSAVQPARRTALSLAKSLERIDGALRQWPAAGLSLLVVAIALGAAMLAWR
jgi:hypothetical protein